MTSVHSVVNSIFVGTQRGSFFGTHLGSVHTVVEVRFEEVIFEPMPSTTSNVHEPLLDVRGLTHYSTKSALTE